MTATELNAHLESGGVIVIATYARATQYTKKHAGWFSERGGSIYVRHGHSTDQLTIGSRWLVGMRMKDCDPRLEPTT